FPFLLADLSDHTTRVTDCYSVRWDVPHHDAPGSNHAVVANRHPRTDDAMSSEPDIVSDVYGFRRLKPAASNLCLRRVKGCVDVNARPDLSIVPDGDEVAVEEHAPVVNEPVPANADVHPVVATERRLDLRAATDLPEQHLQHLEPLLGVFVWEGVQSP